VDRCNDFDCNRLPEILFCGGGRELDSSFQDRSDVVLMEGPGQAVQGVPRLNAIGVSLNRLP